LGVHLLSFGLRRLSEGKALTKTKDKERARLEIGRLPSLRVVDIDSLLLHEEPDRGRLESLGRRIASERCLRNPPVAARDHDTASHVLLDGANRVGALRALGARSVVVQEVTLDDPRLALSTWHHAVEGLDFEQLIRTVSAGRQVARQSCELSEHRDFIPRLGRRTAYLIVLPSCAAYAVRASDGPEQMLDAIREVVALSSAAKNVDRVSYTSLPDLAEHYPALSGVICYRGFSKRDVLELAMRGKMFPSGVTKFSVPKRVISLMVPLSLLEEEGSLEEKQEALEKLVMEKVTGKKIRFYEEPTFYLDD
jgi:hypothetical protein